MTTATGNVGAHAEGLNPDGPPLVGMVGGRLQRQGGRAPLIAERCAVSLELPMKRSADFRLRSCGREKASKV